MSKSKTTYRIGEAAELVGVNTETLRRWDKKGKFVASRHPVNGYRVYTKKQLDQIVKDIGIQYTLTQRPITEKPILQTEWGTLYQTKAVRLLQSLDTESVQVIFADPPYNIKKAQWDTFESQQAYVEWCMEWIDEAERVLKPEGSLYICGFSEILADVKWAASHLFKGCKWLIWFYRNKANLGNDWGRSHESILHFRKSRGALFNIDDVRIPYNAHTLRYPNHPQAKTSQYSNGRSYDWTPHPKGAKPKDVFEIPTLSNNSWERVAHPTQKPVALVKKCILASSSPYDLVVDPFGGSGTSYAVAEAFERSWIGCEPEEEYCSIIRDRLLNRKHIQRIRSGYDERQAIKRREKLRG
jgi:site-specific DNA-methyltransferase (adenine-specific)